MSAATGSRPVDAAALLHHRARLARADAPPWLHAEVARRMSERLAIVLRKPEVVLDWWSWLGSGRERLAVAYPYARIVSVEPDEGLLGRSLQAAARPWWSPRRWASAAPDVRLEAEVAPGGAQLVWSNMMLHAVPNPQAVFAQWHRALAVDGFLMFSTLGPGSLEGLRAIYRARGWPAPHAPFVDMHDLGDMLVEAGFADPVMDQELVTLTYTEPAAWMAELRAIGGNADPARHPGLRTPRWREQLGAAGVPVGGSGPGQLVFEVVYGHAFRPLPRARVTEHTALGVEDLRTLARAGRRKAGPP